MNDQDIADLLHTFFEHDAARVPLAQPEWESVVVMRLQPAPPPPRRRPAVAIAAAALLVAVGVAIFAGPGTDREQGIASSPPDAAPSTMTTQPEHGATTTTVVEGPPVTLADPPESGPPMTIIAAAPTTYHRVAPDVDLAWIDPGDGPQLCWRTPIDQRCVPEPVRSPGDVATVVVPSSPGHTVILVFDAGTDAGVGVRQVTVTSTTGETYLAGVSWADPQLHIGIARVDIDAEEIRDVSP